MNNITPIGKTNWRNSNQVFGIKDEDRLAHVYAIGKTGTGKSTLLLNMVISDIQRGNGVCLIDPHGDVAETVLQYIPLRGIRDTIYFNASDIEYPIAFNPLSGVEQKDHHLRTSLLISTFNKVWSDSWGPRLEYILRFCILTLLNLPSATLLDIQPLLTDSSFRYKVLSHITDASILSFWKNEFDKYSPALKSEAIAPILNKVGVFIASMPLRNIVGQEGCIAMTDIMDGKRILICNLAKGIIGEDASALLGGMIITCLQSTALSRANQIQQNRVPYYVYIDEAHSFATLSLVNMLAKARKFGLSLFLTHQYIDQLDERIRTAIFGNVGTFISFRVGADDAEIIAKEFYPVFSNQDLINLPKYSIYLKLFIDGATSQPFSATTLPHAASIFNLGHAVIEHSRKVYAHSRESVEESIQKKVVSIRVQAQPDLFS